MVRSAKGLEDDNIEWQFNTMLERKFDAGSGLIKLYIEEPSVELPTWPTCTVRKFYLYFYF